MPSTPYDQPNLDVELLAQALVPPSERLTASFVGSETPWWAFGVLSKTCVLLATEARIWLIHYRSVAFALTRLTSIHQLPLPNLETFDVRQSMFGTRIALAGQAEALLVGSRVFGTPGPVACSILLPRGDFAAKSRRVDRARSLASLVESVRACGQTTTSPLFPPLPSPRHPPVSGAYREARRIDTPAPHELPIRASLLDSGLHR